jgi:3-(3-hydroxy-phenyl)propionate hydroxylase
MTPDFDVIVVGYGPTSAILANLLGAKGWKVGVFERSQTVYELPRAVHFDAEVMRIFQRIGLAEEIVTLTETVRGMDLQNARGDLLARYTSPRSTGKQGWHEGYMFHQPALERALREGVGRFANVDVQLGTEIESIRIAESSDAGSVQGTGPSGPMSATARFVIGCCGARSITGQAIQTEVHDFGADRAWIVVDIRLLRDPGLPDVTVQYCDPARPCTYVPAAGQLKRFELMLLAGELASDMLAPERIGELLSRWLQPADYEVVRAAVYTFHATVAGKWRKGPLLVCGDAAHQMPPFLGQGLGSGARDAANLAWKLDLVLRGIASESLLDTYQAERSPHVEAFIESDLWLSNIIQTTDPQVAQHRDQQMSATAGSSALVPPDPPLGPGLCDGSEGSGRPFIQPMLASGHLHDDILGDGFALLGAVQPSNWAQRVLDALGTHRVSQPANEIADWLREHGATAVVVRPDRYVLALVREAQSLDQALEPLAKYLDMGTARTNTGV